MTQATPAVLQLLGANAIFLGFKAGEVSESIAASADQLDGINLSRPAYDPILDWAVQHGTCYSDTIGRIHEPQDAVLSVDR